LGSLVSPDISRHIQTVFGSTHAYDEDVAGGFPILNRNLGSTPRITSLLIKPASAVCNLDCAYCFYLDREADPYSALPVRHMTDGTLDRLVETYLFYSSPNSTFAFQGGEPALAGPAFFEDLVKLQQQYGRNGQSVSNAIQTNGILLNDRWCELFKQYNWLVGISIDGPEPLHDLYRINKNGTGTWRKVMAGVELLKKYGVEFNALCVLSQANVYRAASRKRATPDPECGKRNPPLNPITGIWVARKLSGPAARLALPP
jgi:uncharacterized protein